MDTKGYDDSPPRNGVIFFYTVLAVVVLFGVSQLLKSYFGKMMNAEVYDKVLSQGFEKANETRERERAALEKSGIESAMRAFAQRGHSASPSIAPQSGAGKEPIGGWSQLKKEPPAATPAPAATTPGENTGAQQ